MTLLLDVGNARVKAGLARAGGVLDLGHAAYREAGLGVALDGLGLPAAGRIVAALVAGPAAAGALERWAEARGASLVRVRPRAEAAGVRCGYPEPARLGADRWAALAGARGLTEGPCIVVDAGSAITVDAMAPGGLHLGGYILPGLSMMTGSLLAGTGDLAAFSGASSDRREGDFPTDTRPAIEEAARLAAAGLVRSAQEALAQRAGVPVRVFVTGGDGPVLAPLIEAAETRPMLVLEGLARLAPPG